MRGMRALALVIIAGDVQFALLGAWFGDWALAFLCAGFALLLWLVRPGMEAA